MNKQDYINQVKAIGEYLIDTADLIVEDNNFANVLVINIHADIEAESVPVVQINKQYIPHRIWESLGGKNK